MSPQSSSKLELRELRKLDVNEASQAGRPLFLSAASGLVKIQDRIFVVSDDENCLGYFSIDDTRPGQLFKFSNEQWPLQTDERKKSKTDLEAITEIDSAGFRGLLAVPSGSKPNRNQGYWIELNENLTPRQPKAVNFSNLFKSLEIPDLNIEACFQISGHMVFLHRGNSAKSRNAFIMCNLESLSEGIQTGALTEDCREMTYYIDLGFLKEAKLSFTDACYFHEDRFLYLAVSENTTDTYNDGEFLGAELGCMNIQGEILYRQSLNAPYKPEGICLFSPDSAERRFLIVTDADNPEVPSRLYSGKVPNFD